MLPALIVVSILFTVSTAAAVWLAAQRASATREQQRLTAELDERETELEQSMAQLNDLRDKLGEYNKQLAVAEQKVEGFQQSFAEMQRQTRDTFASVAGDVLKRTNEQFLALAKQKFDGEQQKADHTLAKREQAIENLIKPIKETLEKYQSSLTHVEQARNEAFGQLNEQLRALLEDQKLLRGETAKLVQALRRPEVRGRWGEMQLRRLAELAGMIENCDFTEQETIRTDDGSRLMPDMIVRMPSERSIVVDAKTPLDAFLQALDAESAELREELLERHTQQIESHVRSLSGKQYHAQFDPSPDFVVLFIPGESFLYPAVQRRPQLLEDAMMRNVVIATPTTLISLLKVVAMGWREQRLAENARQISDLGRELHDRLCTATEHISQLGSSLRNAVGAYNRFVGSFETRLLVSGRRFKELGAESGKELPEEITQITNTPRELKEATRDERGGDAESDGGAVEKTDKKAEPAAADGETAAAAAAAEILDVGADGDDGIDDEPSRPVIDVEQLESEQREPDPATSSLWPER